MNDRHNINRLLEIMARLRDPEGGCPWDLEQNFRSIAPYTVEEAHEVADAIERGDLDDLKDELGDLLFQVVFHARMAEEQGAFAFAEVVAAISDKMERRHPHVFGDAVVGDARSQTVNWEQIKAAERAEKGETDDSLLAGVSRGLPALRRSVKLQKRAARVGFDWPAVDPVFDKIIEELDELGAAVAADDTDGIEEELGDLLFAVTNLARKLEVDPGSALRRSNIKFERRFRAMEMLAAGSRQALAELDADALEDLYRQAKVETA
ncbi:nucleoside triphosphate pyrophosphohydrolase [Wenzhouxiangella sp. AB-CW3]|uniref:nucleoside triphosphate pyrophosphohydrolase n=1 Tax=Wenzhouxiangella sp. AB-CW3 TaxID=2771012 RepID=UPI00168B9678|nr:nucleoside triphosphate pyrophosphohydrolase [Wenzhouxiangella sp. AB-CW3]QOC23322.1 nucleoside triphosphate pyrophosphohydrolase [Wenzhouxiangella sp. AB-CW3]